MYINAIKFALVFLKSYVKIHESLKENLIS